MFSVSFDNFIFTFMFFMAVLCALSFVLGAFSTINVKKRIEELASNEIELTPDEFFKIRNMSFPGRSRTHISTYHNYAGVYILHNKTNNMFYVGQAQKVLDRVNQHFTGKGNGDVYADYKYGDEFNIKTISLEKSGYSNLNQLERDTISTYSAFSKGYNKTRGNRY